MPTREQIQKLLALEPNDPFLLYAMAQDHANAEEHQDAINYYNKTLQADPDYTYAYYHKARSLQALSKPDEALQTLDLGLEVARKVNDAKGLSEISSLRTMLV